MDRVIINDGDERSLLGRRPFLAGAGALALAAASSDAHAQQAHKIPIIDTHIHLFDPNRPQGAPYKGPRGSSSNTLGADPVRYAKLARPEGVGRAQTTSVIGGMQGLAEALQAAWPGLPASNSQIRTLMRSPGLLRAIYTLGRKMGRSSVHQRRSGVDAAISGAG